MTDEPAHVVLDLETMGTKPYAPILSIGAVRFRMDDQPIHPSDMFHVKVKLSSCVELGLRPEADTILWWMQQSEAARRGVFEDMTAMDLPNALDEFTTWFNSRPDTVWGNSAAFDCGILKDAYRVCKKDEPWTFWREACYRTMRGLPGIKGVVELERHGTYHDALDDAYSQAMHLRAIYKKLGLV